jgi:hypothetical protein
MLRFTVLPGQRQQPLLIRADDGNEVFDLFFESSWKNVRLTTKTDREEQAIPPLTPKKWRVEISLIDRRFLVMVQDHPLWEKNLPLLEKERLIPRPWLLAGPGNSFPLRESEVVRDLYYQGRFNGRESAGGVWKLERDRFFLIGDNPLISLDSRRDGAMPGVAAERLIGTPILWPQFAPPFNAWLQD